MRSTGWIVLAHLTLLVVFFYVSPPPLPKLLSTPIAIHFRELAPSIHIEPMASAPSQPKPIAKKNPPAPKKVANKAAPIKKDKERGKLLSLMQESLKTLEGTTQKKEPQKNVSRPLGPLASESITFTSDYEQFLASTLESALQFPEKGDVKIQLTLNRHGKIERVHIEKASSARNKAYIEEELLTFSFPPFGAKFKGENSHTFTINFTSS